VRERDTDPPSLLRIVEGFPQILTRSTSVEQAEVDLTNALEEHLKRIQDRETTRIDWDEFPTVRTLRICLCPRDYGVMTVPREVIPVRVS